MKLKILYLILFILIFIPIGLCEIIKDDINLNNTKIYDKNNKIIFIYDKDNEKSMDIKLISTISDIDKLIKIVEITNYIEYIPNKENDFITKTKRIYGKNDIYKIEYFIEKYNYTFENIIINKTIFNNKTGKNESKLINKSIIKNIKPFWIKFKPYNKQIFKNETFKLKIIHYKKPELGFFKIQTIPIFKNIECKEFTWWDGNWNLKRPILINNTNGDNVLNYQLKSVNLSIYQINASSTRIVNESSGLIQNHWNKSINNDGNLMYVWCNFSEIINNTWVNNTYYIYYQSLPNVNSISNGTNTFISFFNGDSTGWIEVDINNHIAFINNRLEFINLTRNEDAYVYQNINVDNNIIIEWEYKSTSGHISGIITHGILSDDLDDFININNGFGVYLYSINTYIRQSIRVSNIGYYGNEGIIDDIIHYAKCIRNDNTVTTYIYKDVNKTNLDANTSVTQNGLPILNYVYLVSSWNSGNIYNYNGWMDNFTIRKYTLNEPKLWTVGDIEYPGGINMTCNLKIITHLTEKEIQFINMTGDIVNTSKTNECVNLTYDSYIVYMSNPVKISSFTGLLNILDNFLVQFLLFIFLIIIATLFYVFIQIVKKKGFKL